MGTGDAAIIIVPQVTFTSFSRLASEENPRICERWRAQPSSGWVSTVVSVTGEPTGYRDCVKTIIGHISFDISHLSLGSNLENGLKLRDAQLRVLIGTELSKMGQ
jgi:hypothetical protein